MRKNILNAKGKGQTRCRETNKKKKQEKRAEISYGHSFRCMRWCYKGKHDVTSFDTRQSERRGLTEKGLLNLEGGATED